MRQRAMQHGRSLGSSEFGSGATERARSIDRPERRSGRQNGSTNVPRRDGCQKQINRRAAS